MITKKQQLQLINLTTVQHSVEEEKEWVFVLVRDIEIEIEKEDRLFTPTTIF